MEQMASLDEQAVGYGIDAEQVEPVMEDQEGPDSSAREKRTKKKRSEEIVFKRTDYLILYALYLHRKLNPYQIYTLVFNGKAYYNPKKNEYLSSYHPGSLRRRLKKLADTGYIQLEPFILTFVDQAGEIITRKMPYYRLTQRGMEVVITKFFDGQLNEKYGPPYNVNNKYYFEVNELDISNMEHHNALQNVVTRTIDLVIQNHDKAKDFTDLIYGDGKRFRLHYGANNDNHPLYFYPDFVFFNVEHISDEDRHFLEWCTLNEAQTYLLERKPRIVLEEDTGNQNLKQIAEKHKRYLKHLKLYQSFYSQHPLLYVYSVKNNAANNYIMGEAHVADKNIIERQRRIISLKQYTQQAFYPYIREKLILPYVVDDLSAPELLSQLILDQTEDISGFVERVKERFKQQSGYRFKKKYTNFIPHFNSSADCLIEFEHPENQQDTFYILIQHLRPGDVHGEVVLMEAARWLHTGGKAGMAMGVMDHELDLRREAFYLQHKQTGQEENNRLLNYLFFTTPDVFEKGEGWVVCSYPSRKGITFKYMRKRKLVEYFV
jgi:hypothetical protein